MTLVYIIGIITCINSLVLVSLSKEADEERPRGDNSGGGEK